MSGSSDFWSVLQSHNRNVALRNSAAEQKKIAKASEASAREASRLANATEKMLTIQQAAAAVQEAYNAEMARSEEMKRKLFLKDEALSEARRRIAGEVVDLKVYCADAEKIKFHNTLDGIMKIEELSSRLRAIDDLIELVKHYGFVEFVDSVVEAKKFISASIEKAFDAAGGIVVVEIVKSAIVDSITLRDKIKGIEDRISITNRNIYEENSQLIEVKTRISRAYDEFISWPWGTPALSNIDLSDIISAESDSALDKITSDVENLFNSASSSLRAHDGKKIRSILSVIGYFEWRRTKHARYEDWVSIKNVRENLKTLNAHRYRSGKILESIENLSSRMKEYEINLVDLKDRYDAGLKMISERAIGVDVGDAVDFITQG